MICSKCGLEMKIASARYVSEVGTTDVFYEAKMVCLNPQCEDYEPSIESPVKYIVDKSLVK
jgi:hypothetical protein